MAGVALSLYRALRRSIRSYDRHAFPLLGAPGFGLAADLPPAAALRDAFTTSQHRWTYDDGFRLLRSLGGQLNFLRNADEDVQQALRGWHSVIQASQRQHPQRNPHNAAQALAAAEALLQQLQQNLHHRRQQQDILLDDTLDTPGAEQDAGTSTARLLDELATNVAANLQQQTPGAASTSGRSVAEGQLAAISQVLFKEMQLKHHPLEWVYDGLDPLMLPKVLSNRKGVPLVLAVIYAGVAHRLGLPVALVKSAAGGLPMSGKGAEGIPSDLLARQAGRATVSAPSPPAWLVMCREDMANVAFVDVMHKGEVMDFAACSERHPAITMQPASHHHTLALVAADLARTALTAHQRRGESDEAAHWLYIALALDPTAPEWQHFLGSSSR